MIDFENTTDDFAGLAARAPASVFDAFASAANPARRHFYEQLCEVVALPGRPLHEAPQPGDVILRRGEAGLAHVAVVAAHGLWPREQLPSMSLRPEGNSAGLYVHVVEGGAFPHSIDDGFARLVADPSGRVPSNQLLLRPRRRGFATPGEHEAGAPQFGLHFLEAAIPSAPSGRVMPTPVPTRPDEIKAPPGFSVVDDAGEPLTEGEYAFHQGGVVERGQFNQLRKGRVDFGKIDPTRPFIFEVRDRVCAISLGAYLDPDDPAIEYGGTWFDWTLVRDDRQPDEKFWPHYRREMDFVSPEEFHSTGPGMRVVRFLQHEHITRRPVQIAKPFLTQLSRVRLRASPPRIRVGPFVRYSDHERAAIWLETLTPSMVRVRYKKSSGGQESSRYASTVRVGGRHFVAVEIDGLKEDIFYDYTVELAPLPATGNIPVAQADFANLFPALTKAVAASVKEQLKMTSLNRNEWLTFRTLRRVYKDRLRFATGSCRWYPGDEKIDLSKNEPVCDVKPSRTELKPRKKGVALGSEDYKPDMLRGLGDWLREHARERELWPHFLFFSGDQIYSDEIGIDHGAMLAVGRYASRVPGPADPATSLREKLIDGAWAGRFAHRYKAHTAPDAKTIERISNGIEKIDAIHHCYSSIKQAYKLAPLDDRAKVLKRHYDTVDTKWRLSKTQTEPPEVRSAREALELIPTLATLELTSEPFRAHLYHWQAVSHDSFKRNPMNRRFLSHNFVLWNIPDFEKDLPTVADKQNVLVARGAGGGGHPSAEGGRHAADFAEYAYLYERAWTSSPSVRVLLAHVPTFLMFDDHELTDDWNFDITWVRMLHNRKDDFLMWPKTLTDALAAYWVYQGWGNKAPSKWKGDDERIKALDDARRRGVDALPALRRCIYRACFAQVPTDKQATFQTGLSLEWHYRLPFDPPFIVPDCRSRKKMSAADDDIREIKHPPQSKGPQSQTIDDEQLKWMSDILFAWRGGPVAFIGTSTPFLLQKKLMEFMTKPESVALGWAQGLDIASFGAALFSTSRDSVTNEMIRVFRRAKDLEHMIRDRSWSDLWGMVGKLNKQGSPLKTLVIVSGDVHHSYNMTANLPGKGRPKPELVQLTSSGLQTTVRGDAATAIAEDFSALPFNLGDYQLVPGFMVKNGINDADVALYENSVALVDVGIGSEVNLVAAHLTVKEKSHEHPVYTGKDLDKYVFKYTSGPAYMEGHVPAALKQYWREKKLGPGR